MHHEFVVEMRNKKTDSEPLGLVVLSSLMKPMVFLLTKEEVSLEVHDSNEPVKLDVKILTPSNKCSLVIDPCWMMLYLCLARV